MNEIFFELIQIALGNADGLSHAPSVHEWKQLYDMAKKQSLVGICFAGVQKLNSLAPSILYYLPEMDYLRWMGMAAKIQQRNELVNRHCVELQAKLSADGFRSYIMKGQGVAQLYDASLRDLRQSGDIDVYLEGGLVKVLAYACSFGMTKQVNELEMHVDVFSDTEVEFHYRPYIMRNPIKNMKLQNFFMEESEKCFENKIALINDAGEIVVPSSTFNMVHQMVHIHIHLFTEGIGMRQLMDYYFVVKHEMEVRRGADIMKVQEVVESLGLDKFASALMWVLGNVFGLPKEQMIWDSDERDGRFLLDEILWAGNFGKYDDRLSHEDVSKWQSFWRMNARNLRLSRFNKTDWFWGPLWRIYHFAWRKIHGYK